MINKVYVQIIEYIKEFKWLFLFLFLFFISENIYLPYYIEAPGGLSDVSDRLVITDGYDSKGSFNMAYVSEYKVNVPLYLYSFINDDWDLIKIDDNNVSREDDELRSHIMMDTSVSNAIIVAFTYSNNYFEIINTKNYISYISNKAKTTLEIGDEILSVNDNKISKLSDVTSIINNLNEESIVRIEVQKDDKIITRIAEVYKENDKLYIGISIETLYEVETNKEVINNIRKNEIGPSGGLLMALSLYDSLTIKDITKGYKIAGTGTISAEGIVGEIGGIEYKIKGAVKDKADIFLVPSANYEDAKKVINENNYSLKLVKVDTFTDALNYLETLKHK